MSLNSDIITQAASLAANFWQPIVGEPCFVGTSCNSVFTIRPAQSDTDLYLRLTDSGYRSQNEVRAELDFVTFLNAGGAAVSMPVPSCNGDVLHRIEIDGHVFWASAFTAIEGEMLRYSPEPGNRASLIAWGRALGEIHRIAAQYTPAPSAKRFSWDLEPVLANAERYLPQTECAAIQELGSLRAWLAEAPRDSMTFGMIHGDFGRPNCRILNGRVAAFDFDDCCFHWYAYDLAIMVYPCRFQTRPERLTYLRWIVEGYRQARALDDFWIRNIGYFMRLRGLWMFIYHCKTWELANLTDHQRGWFAQMRETFLEPIDW